MASARLSSLAEVLNSVGKSSIFLFNSVLVESGLTTGTPDEELFKRMKPMTWCQKS